MVFTFLGRTTAQFSALATANMESIERWLQGGGLKFAHLKTEFMIFCTHHVPQLGELQTGGHSIQSTETLKYLGVDLCHKQHHSWILKGWSIRLHGSRMPWPAWCRISVVLRAAVGDNSSMSATVSWYGVATWGRCVLDKETHRKMLQRAHRSGALQVASAFQTVSYDATCVVASTTPLVLLMQEDIHYHDEKIASGDVQSDIRKRQREERRWQDQWTTGAGQSGAPGLKTRRLIPDINLWVGRKHGEVDVFLTQLHTGHRFLRSGLRHPGWLLKIAG